MSQARLPRTEPSTELITAHKVNHCDALPGSQTRDFSALPKHRAPWCAVISSIEGSVRGKRACDTQLASSLVTAT